MAYNVAQALKDGLSEEEIAKHLAKTRNYRFDEAIKAGVPHREIIDHLAPQKSVVAKPTVQEALPKPTIEKPPAPQQTVSPIAPPGMINPNLMIPEGKILTKPSPVTVSQPGVDLSGFPKELIPSHEPVKTTLGVPPAEPSKDFGLRPDGTPKVREPYPSELDYFRKNPHVSGMAAEDNAIILNPLSKLSEQEKDAVIRNESARIRMRTGGNRPAFTLTENQKKRFSGYGNDQDIRETIAARILSGDPSARDATEEQRRWVNDNLRPASVTGKEGEQPLSDAERAKQVSLAERAKANAPQIGMPTRKPEQRAFEPLMKAIGISKEGISPLESAKASNLVALSEATGGKISPSQIEPVYEELMEQIGFKQYPTPMELYPKLAIAGSALLAGGGSLALGAVRTGLGIAGFLGTKEAESLATQVLAGEKPKFLQGREAKEFLGPLKEPYATGAEVGELILPTAVAGKIAWGVRNWFRKQPSTKQGEVIKLLEDKMKHGQSPADIAKEWKDPNVIEAQWKDVKGQPPTGPKATEPLKPLSVGPPGVAGPPEPIGSMITTPGTPAIAPPPTPLVSPPGTGMAPKLYAPETPEPIGSMIPMGISPIAPSPQPVPKAPPMGVGPIAPQPKPIETPTSTTPIPQMMGMGVPVATPEERPSPTETENLGRVTALRENTDRLIQEGGYEVAKQQPRSRTGEATLLSRGYKPMLWDEATGELGLNSLGVWVKEPQPVEEVISAPPEPQIASEEAKLKVPLPPQALAPTISEEIPKGYFPAEQWWENTPQEREEAWQELYRYYETQGENARPELERLQKEYKSLKGKGSGILKEAVKEKIDALKETYRNIIAIGEGNYVEENIKHKEAAETEARKAGVSEDDFESFINDYDMSISTEAPYYEQNYNKTNRQIFNELVDEYVGKAQIQPAETLPEEGPIIAYHGTRDEISAFSPLSHFGTEKASEDALMSVKGKGKATKIKAELNIKNPLEVKDTSGTGIEEVVSWAWDATDQGVLTETQSNEIENLFFEDQKKGTEALINALQEKGYDGLKYVNKTEDPGSTSWVAFSPGQVKTIPSREALPISEEELEKPLVPVIPPSEWQKDPVLVADAEVVAKRVGVSPDNLDYQGIQEFDDKGMHQWDVTDPNSPQFHSAVYGPIFKLSPEKTETAPQPSPIRGEGVKEPWEISTERLGVVERILKRKLPKREISMFEKERQNILQDLYAEDKLPEGYVADEFGNISKSPEVLADYPDLQSSATQAVPPTAQHLELMPEEYPNIVAAALKQDGKIYKDTTHGNILIENNLDPEKAIPGFVTKEGRFVEQYPKAEVAPSEKVPILTQMRETEAFLSESSAKKLLSLPYEQRTSPYGDQNAKFRKQILKELTGQDLPKNKAGSTRVREELTKAAGIDTTGKAPVEIDREIHEWLRGIAGVEKKAEVTLIEPTLPPGVGAVSQKPKKVTVGDRAKEFYQPGNIIYVDYWKQYDKILKVKGTAGEGDWSVQVQQVDKEGNAAPDSEPRWHTTLPSKGDRIEKLAPPAKTIAQEPIKEVAETTPPGMGKAEAPLPTKAIQHSIDQMFRASEIIRTSTKKKAVESAYVTLKTHGPKLGIEIYPAGTYYGLDRYRKIAGDTDVAIGQKYGTHPTEEMRAKRDAVTIKGKKPEVKPILPTVPPGTVTSQEAVKEIAATPPGFKVEEPKPEPKKIEPVVEEVPTEPGPSLAVQEMFKKAYPDSTGYGGGRGDRIYLLKLAIGGEQIGKLRTRDELYDAAKVLAEDLGYSKPPDTNKGWDRHYAEQIAKETGQPVRIIRGSVIVEPPPPKVELPVEVKTLAPKEEPTVESKPLKWADLPEGVRENIPEELTDLRTEPYFGTQVIKGEKSAQYNPDKLITHVYDAKTGQELHDWELGKIRSKVEDEQRYEARKTEIAQLPDVEGKKVEPTEERSVQTQKDQKKYLIDSIDEAIKQAPDKEVEPVLLKIPDTEPKPIMEKTPHVIIEVPGDGTFRVINSKQALQGFKKVAEERFPGTQADILPPGLRKTSMPSQKPSGRRISPEKESAYEYIAEYSPKRVSEGDYAAEKKVLVGEGWFTNGQYMVKGPPPATFGKKAEKEVLTKETIKQITPSLKGMSPATHVAEFHVMDSAINGGIAISDKGAAYFNPALMDVIRKHQPDSTLYIRDETSPMVFVKDKEVVGILMPMRGDDTGGLVEKYFIDQGIKVPWEKEVMEEEAKAEVAPTVEKPPTPPDYDALFKTFKNQTPNQATDYFTVEGHKVYRVEEVELPKEMGGTGLGSTDDAEGNIYLRKDLNRQGFEKALGHELRHHKEKGWEETVKLADMIEPPPAPKAGIQEKKVATPAKEKSIDEIVEEDYKKMMAGSEDRIKQNIMNKAKRELDVDRITQEKYDELAKKYSLEKAKEAEFTRTTPAKGTPGRTTLDEQVKLNEERSRMAYDLLYKVKGELKNTSTVSKKHDQLSKRRDKFETQYDKVQKEGEAIDDQHRTATLEDYVQEGDPLQRLIAKHRLKLISNEDFNKQQEVLFEDKLKARGIGPNELDEMVRDASYNTAGLTYGLDRMIDTAIASVRAPALKEATIKKLESLDLPQRSFDRYKGYVDKSSIWPDDIERYLKDAQKEAEETGPQVRKQRKKDEEVRVQTEKEKAERQVKPEGYAIVDANGEWTKVDGSPVKTPKLPDYEFFTYKSPKGWIVTEGSTGRAFTRSQPKKSDAIDEFNRTIESVGVDKVKASIKSARKEGVGYKANVSIKETPEGTIEEVAPQEGKKPWMMSKKEYFENWLVQGTEPGQKRVTISDIPQKQIPVLEKWHEEEIKQALTSGDLTPAEYTRLHEKDYGPIEEFGAELTGKTKEPLVIDEETYLSQKGAGRGDIGEAALHKNIPEGNVRKRLVERQAQKDKAVIEKRAQLREEYNKKVESGEIRPPTRMEKLISAANGMEDNESTQAARKLLEGKGIDWKNPTGAELQSIAKGKEGVSEKAKEPWDITESEWRKTPPLSGDGPYWALFHRSIMAKSTFEWAQKAALDKAIADGIAPEPEKISDFGKKIGGAKKDLWKDRGLSLEDVKDMTLQERETYTKKAHVWPTTPYEKFVEDGMTPGMAMLVKKIKDSISIQPEIPRTAVSDPKLREEAMKRYIELVSAIREKLPTVRTLEDLRALKDELFPVTRKGEWSHDSFVYTEQANKDLQLLGGSNVSKAFQPRKYDLVNAQDKAEKTGFPAKQEAWQKQYVVRFDKAGDKVYRDGKEITLDKDEWFVTKKDAHYILQGELSSREEAEAWAKDQAKAKGEHLTRPFRENIERTGPDYRKGKNKTGDEILSEFGFRGGEFGNWTNQADRQQALNEAYDALMDLADTLKVPPQALSLNGELGIAFGARGGGSASAHYEPGRVVINLTKTRGAGSLAHEWAHAVDDYFGRQVTGGLPGKYVSHGAQKAGEARKEMLDAWGEVMKAISDRVAGKEANIAMEEKGVKQMTSYINSWLRPVDAYLKENPKADTDDVRTLLSMLHGEKPNQWNGEKIGPQGVATRLRLELIKSGYKMSTDDARKIGNNAWHLEKAQINLAKAEAGELVRTEKTDFLKNALAKGKGKSDNYWQRKHELFARAFESFVEDELNNTGNKSDYLVHSTNESPTSPWGAIYPQGKDRVSVNGAFKKWVDTLKTKEEGKTIILYSRASEKRKGGFNEPETKPIGPTRLAKNLQADLEVSWGKKFPERAIIEVNLPKNGKALRELGRVFGKQVVFVEGEPLSARNGVTIVESPGIIYINAKAEAPHLVTLGHELIHTLKIDEPDLYQKLLDTTEGLIQNFHVFQKLLDDSSIASGIKSEKGEAAKEELYAEFTGEQFLNTTFWKKLHDQDPTLFKRAIKIVKDLIDRAVDWLKGQISIKNTFFKDIRKVQDNLASIMKEYAKKADAKRVEGGLNPYAAAPLVLPFLMGKGEEDRKKVYPLRTETPSYLPPGLGR